MAKKKSVLDYMKSYDQNARKASDEVAFSSPSTSKKAETVKKSKSFWEGLAEGAGDVVEGIGEGLWKGGAQAVGSLASAGSSLITGDKENAVTKESKKWQQAAEDWGNKVNANDVGEFIGNLPGGIVSGVTDEASNLIRGARNTPEMIAANIAAGSGDKYVRQEGVKKQKEIQKKMYGEDVANRGDAAMALSQGADTLGGIVDIATGGVGGKAIKEGAKQVAKTAAKSGAINVATGVPISAMQQLSQGQEVNAGTLAKDALIQGATGALLGGVSKASAVKKANKVIDETPTTKTTPSQGVIPESNRLTTGEIQGTLPEGQRVFNTADDISKELNEVQTGTGRYAEATPEERTAKFKELRTNLDIANKQEARTDFTTPSRTFDETSRELDSVGAGGVAPEAVIQRKDYTDITEIPKEQNMPAGIKERSLVLQDGLSRIQEQKASLMTEDRSNMILDDMDKVFNENMDRINSMPEPRRTVEAEKLQNDYNNEYDKIQQQKESDAPKAFQLQRLEEQLNANSQQLLFDANTIKNNNPTEFGEIDQELNDKISQEIEQEAETALFNRMSKQDGIPESENVSKAWLGATDEKIDAGLESKEVGDLTAESLKDTFEDELNKELTSNLKVKALDSLKTSLEMSSSSHNLVKIFGDAGKKVFGRIVKGYARMNEANSADSKILTSIKKSLGGSKELYSKAVDILEGKDVDLSGLTDKQKAGIDTVVKLRDKYTRMVRVAAYKDAEHSFKSRLADGNVKYTADEIKQLAERDNTTIKEAKDKYGNITKFADNDIDFLSTNHAKNSTIENYYPHMFDEKGKEVVNKDNEYVTSSGNVKFGNMLHRMSEGDNYSRDIIDVFANYAAGLNKKIYLEPSLRELDNAKWVIKAADAQSKPVWDWVDKYQAQLKYNKPSELAKSFNEVVDRTIAKMSPNSKRIGQNHYRQILSTQRQVNSLASLGLSFRNGIQQFSQLGTAIGELGTKDVLAGSARYLSQKLNPSTSKAYSSIMEERGIHNAGIAKEAYSELGLNALQSSTKNVGDKISSGLMFMSSKMDEFARGSTYEASLISNLKKGLSRDDAESAATADAARLNFLTSKVDMPIKLNSDGVRSLAQFMTFSYKQAEAWKDLGLKPIQDVKSGNYRLAAKDMSRLLQMVAFYGVAFEGMSQIAGIDPEDNIPFWGNIVGDSGLPRSPLISTLFGNNSGTSPGIIDIVNGIVKPEGDSSFEKEENRNDMYNKLGDLIVKNFIPAGGQISKSISGAQSTENDGVVSKDGKVKFIQNTDESSKMKATLFGQYSTEAGKEWINKKFPTLSEKQSEILNKQKTAEAKQKAYDFYSGLKNAQLKSSVTPDIKEIIKTEPNRAQRLIKEHNDKVKEAEEAYTAKYGELSDYEKNYLTSKYYITVKNIENLD